MVELVCFIARLSWKEVSLDGVRVEKHLTLIMIANKLDLLSRLVRCVFSATNTIALIIHSLSVFH